MIQAKTLQSIAKIAIFVLALGPKRIVMISMHKKDNQEINMPPSNARYSVLKIVLLATDVARSVWPLITNTCFITIPYLDCFCQFTYLPSILSYPAPSGTADESSSKERKKEEKTQDGYPFFIALYTASPFAVSKYFCRG